jgi:hypothetical protein
MHLLILAFLVIAASADAQTVTGERFRLSTGPCVARSGSGSPEAVVTGNVCDTWVRTDTGQTYKKVSGTGNTGWYPVVGATGATCASFVACAAAQLSFDTTVNVQKLRTDTSYRSQYYVNTDGATLNAFNGGGWMPLKLWGGPVRVGGGGFHVGSSDIVDPGLGNAGVDGYIGQPGYVSQTTGWRIDSLGAADFRYLYTDELHAKAFIADLEQALAGGQIISKSVAQVGAVFTVPGPGSISTLTVKDLPSAANMAVFESGDYLRVRQFSRASGSLTITDAWGIVTSYADAADGLQTWLFTRLVTNGGAMTTGAEIGVDAIVLDYGTSGNGFHEVNAIDGLYGVNSPYSQIVTWSGDSPIAANQTVRTRLGNLRGITGVTGEYGLIAGTYAATNGAYLRASNQAFELHGIDLMLWNGSTNVMRVDHLTPYWSMGAPAPTSFSSGTGCWSGMDAGVFKWRCGDISGGTQYIAWNGTQLQVAGNIVVTGTSIDASTVTGVAGATVVSGAARGLLGIDSNGNPLLPASATPSGSGLFLGSDKLGYYASGAWKTYMDNSGNFYLGGTSGALTWNGTTLAVTGTVVASAGQIAGWTIGAASLYLDTGVDATSAGMTPIDWPFYAGHQLATRSTAPFRVSAAGALVATNATITGAITATSGSFTGNGSGVTNINGGNITAASITGTQIAAGTISASEIASGTITATQIASGSITADRLSVSSLSALSADLGSITAGWLSLGGGNFTVNGSNGEVFANFIDSNEIYTGYAAIDTLDFNSISGTGWGGGGNRYVCVDNSGELYVTGGGC